MTRPTLPEVIEILDTTAAALRFDPSLTARDRSLQLVVSWWAGQRPPPEGQYSVMVPDSIRKGLSDHRRIPRERRAKMWERMDNSVMSSDETNLDLMDGVPAPTTQPVHRAVRFDKDGPEGGKREWLVESEIVDAFKVYQGDSIVELPTMVLERARSRYTLTLLLRLLAWGTEAHPKKWRRWAKPDHYVLRIPLAELQAELGTEPGKAPAEMLRKELKPAVQELQLLTNFPIDIAAWHAPSLKKRLGGRIMGFDIIVPRIEPKTSKAGLPRPVRKPAEVIALHTVRAGDYPSNVDELDEDIAF